MAAESGEKVEPSDVLKYSTCVKKCPSADVAEAVECSKTRAMLEGVSSKYYHEFKEVSFTLLKNVIILKQDPSFFLKAFFCCFGKTSLLLKDVIC